MACHVRTHRRLSVVATGLISVLLVLGVYALPERARAGDVVPTRGIDCGADIPGAAALLKQSRVLMLGEMHGSAEAPALVGALACHAVAAGRSVQVGVELPRAEAGAVAKYLAGPGGSAERAVLLAGAFWQRPEQDGRSSEAMLALIERVRQLRHADARIDLFAFDAAPDAAWNERDSAMANAILTRANQHAKALVITLSGNLHARSSKGLPWDPDAMPMAAHVRARLPDALALEMRHRGGAVWVCQPDAPCGPMDLPTPPSPSPPAVPAIERWPTRNEHGLDGVFQLGALTASKPAKDLASRRSGG